jgi:hypothetical protein
MARISVGVHMGSLFFNGRMLNSPNALYSRRSADASLVLLFHLHLHEIGGASAGERVGLKIVRVPDEAGGAIRVRDGRLRGPSSKLLGMARERMRR